MIPGIVHHIIQRGDNRQDVFSQDVFSQMEIRLNRRLRPLPVGCPKKADSTKTMLRAKNE